MGSRLGISLDAYNREIETLRDQEYPSLKGVAYLDHGGSAIPAKSLLQDAFTDLSTHLYGNPHSASAPSALAGRRVDEIRDQTLSFFNADPEHFDLVFVANATAATKLVMDAFRDHCQTTQNLSRPKRRQFWYGYHRDAHNSLIGVREAADGGHHCFGSDQDVEDWIQGAKFTSAKYRKQVRLFGYCGQSNMTGRRLPLSWPSQIRNSPHTADAHVLFDAAALATTAPLDFSNPQRAPDFTCLSFYKIFGFPDLGALIIRKSSPGALILTSRRYFGGGTVDMVTCPASNDADAFHAKKTTAPHAHLEDGTLPFHSILALSAALCAHARLFRSMRHVSAHTAALTARLHARLSHLRHRSTGAPLVVVYNDGGGGGAVYGDPRTQGAAVAFNVRGADGAFVAPSAVERAADARGVYLRSGSLCNPGGAAAHLGWSAAQLRRLYDEAGLRCSRPAEVVAGRPTGVVRCSLGAVSTVADVDAFLAFLEEEFVDRAGVGLAGGDGGEDATAGSVRLSAELGDADGEKNAKTREKGFRGLFLSCFSGSNGPRDAEVLMSRKASISA